MAKQTIEIKLYMSEVVYDVVQKAFLVGDAVKTNENAEQTAKIQELEGEKKDLILRSFGNSLGLIRLQLGEYIVEDGHYADNLLLQETREKMKSGLIFGFRGRPAETDESERVDNTLVFLLRVPSNWQKASKEAIASALHALMVNNALVDWFTIYAPDRVEAYAASSAADLATLKAAINSRQRPTRPHAPEDLQPITNDIRYE